MEIKIAHGMVAGVDTAKLEKRMRAADWAKHPGHWIYSQDDPNDMALKQMRRMEKDFEKVMRGAATPKEELIWEQLMIKYWSDTPLKRAISENVPYLEANFSEYHQLKAISMNTAVNYYELKTQLADLGYNAPEVTDQLREIVSQNEFDHAIVHTRQDGVKFEIEMERNSKGDFELLFNNAILDMGEDVYSHYFKPDVSADEAVNFLRNEEKFHWPPDDEPNLDGPLDDDYIYEMNYKLQNQNTMNTQNLSYLQKQLLNLGFGEGMNKELEKNIEAKTPEFTLNSTNDYNKQNVDYKLHFKAGEKDDMYFFNKYDASLQGKDMAQTFYINKGSGITAKEAYNLMEGRAVHKELENKEGEKYKAWIMLDKENKTENGNLKLKTFSEGWNYRPERAIDKIDIVGINEEGARDKLMKSLEKGNRHQVTAMKDGKEVKLFIEANPAEHRVNLTNWKGEAQQLEHYKKPEAKQEQKKTEIQTEETSKKKSKGHKMSV